MNTRGDVLESLATKTEEKAKLIKILQLWEIAEKAGYTPDEVQTFTFRGEYLTKKEKRSFSRSFRHFNAMLDEAKIAAKYHNCVRLKTGELKPIPLTERPK